MKFGSSSKPSGRDWSPCVAALAAAAWLALPGSPHAQDTGAPQDPCFGVDGRQRIAPHERAALLENDPLKALGLACALLKREASRFEARMDVAQALSALSRTQAAALLLDSLDAEAAPVRDGAARLEVARGELAGEAGRNIDSGVHFERALALLAPLSPARRHAWPVVNRHRSRAERAGCPGTPARTRYAVLHRGDPGPACRSRSIALCRCSRRGIPPDVRVATVFPGERHVDTVLSSAGTRRLVRSEVDSAAIGRDIGNSTAICVTCRGWRGRGRGPGDVDAEHLRRRGAVEPVAGRGPEHEPPHEGVYRQIQRGDDAVLALQKAQQQALRRGVGTGAGARAGSVDWAGFFVSTRPR